MLCTKKVLDLLLQTLAVILLWWNRSMCKGSNVLHTGLKFSGTTVYNDDLFATASWSLVMNSSTGIVPISPLCLDLIVRVLAWTSLGPTTAMSGTFCVSAFLISFGRRSPWQTSTRNPLDFSSEATSLQYCNWKEYKIKMSWFHK